MKTCKNGDLDGIIYLGPTHGMGDEYEASAAVVKASQYGHLKVVKYIVEECDTYALGLINYAFYKAARFGHIEMVKYLIKYTNIQCYSFALQHAILNGQEEVVTDLVEKCATDTLN